MQQLWPEPEGVAYNTYDQLGRTIAVRDTTSRQSLAAEEQVYDMSYQTSAVKLGGGSLFQISNEFQNARLGPQQHYGINTETARTKQRTKNGHSLTAGRQSARSKVAQSQTSKPSRVRQRASRAKEFEEIESRKQAYDL
jgi:hypothetical protein